MDIPRAAIEAGWHASARTTRTEVARIIAAALEHIPSQRDGKQLESLEDRSDGAGMILVATRGERTITWKCVDTRELQRRAAQFRAEGYTVVR